MKLPSHSGVRPTDSMPTADLSRPSRANLRKLVWLCALPASALLAQGIGQPMIPGQVPPAQRPASSTLPATAPTSTPIAPLAATPTAAQPANRPHRAQVSYDGSEVVVVANDSSLHQILRSIADRTHITITGGLADQRVFGTYGPAPVSTVLATLLDGTGVNVLFRAGDSDRPGELVLTQRSGGPSGSPITAADDDLGDAPTTATPTARTETVAQPAAQPREQSPPASGANAVPSGPPSIPQPANNVLGSPSNVTPTASQIPTVQSVPIDSVPTPSTTVQTQQGIVDSPNPPPAGSTTAPTPDSIYQQLLQLQQQKAAANGGSPAVATPSAPPQP